MLSSSDSDEEFAVNVPARRRKVYRRRINFNLTDGDFRERFRLTRAQADDVLLRIGDILQPPTNKGGALTATEKLLLTLRFVASGEFYYSVGDSHGYSKGAVCAAVHEVVAVINQRLFQEVVRWPEAENELRQIPQRFHRLAGFPAVCGALDGTLIKILAPSEHEQAFVDRHGNHSLNVLAVAGPDYQFYSVSARWPGATHDARVLRNSHLAQRFEAGYRPFPNAVLLGDSAYPLKEWLMTIIFRNQLTAQEMRFNDRHCRTRRMVECAFGILKNRFTCLSTGLRVKQAAFAAEIIKACTALHNLCLRIEPIDDEPEVVYENMDDLGLESEDDDDNEVEAPANNGLIRQREIVNYLNNAN